MKSLIVSVAVAFCSNIALAQDINGGPINVPADGIIDGVVVTEHIPTKRMIPYEFVREADMVWSKRVWETIDLREKINHPLYYPFDEITNQGVWVKHAQRWSLWTVIRTHVINGDLTVFSPYNPYNMFGEKDGDQLKYPVYPTPGMNYFTDSAYREKMVYYMGRMGAPGTVELVDENGEAIIDYAPDGTMSYRYDPPDTVWYTSKDIIQYKLKEDWFFDKERSVLDVRIIAICPVVYERQLDANGVESVSGTLELFWLYFPHCRFVFNNYFVYNDKNDSQWMSFDDLFWKRKFNAVANKASNNFDRKIETYKTGVDALYEAQKIKEDIRTIEHDVWDF